MGRIPTPTGSDSDSFGDFGGADPIPTPRPGFARRIRADPDSYESGSESFGHNTQNRRVFLPKNICEIIITTNIMIKMYIRSINIL